MEQGLGMKCIHWGWESTKYFIVENREGQQSIYSSIRWGIARNDRHSQIPFFLKKEKRLDATLLHDSGLRHMSTKNFPPIRNSNLPLKVDQLVHALAQTAGGIIVRAPAIISGV